MHKNRSIYKNQRYKSTFTESIKNHNKQKTK